MKLLLTLFALAALASGQTGTVKTRAELYTHFADGQAAGAIVPERMRDLVATALFGPSSASDGGVVVFDSTTGQLVKQFSGSGIGILSSGVLSTSNSLQWNATTGIGLIKPLTLGQITNEIGTLNLWGTSSKFTIQPAAATAEWTLTLPANNGDANQVLATDGSGGTSWVAAGGAAAPLTLTGSTDATQLTVKGNATQTGPIFLVEKSDGTDILVVNNDGSVQLGSGGANELTAIATPATPASGDGALYLDSTSKRITVKDDAGLVKPSTFYVYTGSQALGTGALSANTCATAIDITATGVLATDVVRLSESADWSAITGYGSASTDGLLIYKWPTTDAIHIKVCNGTGASITPGAATVNIAVTR